MGKICWDFPLLGTGNESGSNIAAITMFSGSGIMDGLAREVIQNSLDAVSDKTKPVHLDITQTYIRRDDFPEFFDGLEEAVNSSITYWKSNPNHTDEVINFIEGVKSNLEAEQIPVLVCSDYNTTGLNGVSASDDEQSIWKLLVDTEGVSIKKDENSAGSYGIGKNAPFAYSNLNLVLYNTLAEDGGIAFEGVARLVTTRKLYNNELRKTQPIGKYLYLIDDYTGRPIMPDDNCSIAKLPIFDRSSTHSIGTDVAIVGFDRNNYENWERLTAVSVISNFILAIKNDKLTVTIKNENDVLYDIKSATLEKYLFTILKDEDQLKYSRQAFETINSPDNISSIHNKICEDGDLSIFVKFNERYEKSVLRFRSTGMLINKTDRSLPGYSVVLVVNETGESILSKTLRKCEPPQHNDWKSSTIKKDPVLRNQAKNYLKKITSAIQKALDELDNATIEDSMDAGIGNYLPGKNNDSSSSTGTDGLRTDLKINRAVSNEGYVIFNSQYESGTNTTGENDNNNAVRAGKKKRKRRKKTKIITVTPTSSGTTKGVSKGVGKLKVSTLIFDETRTSKIGSLNKYILYVNSPKEYDHVFIRYAAGRDDQGEDPLLIKNYKFEGSKSLTEIHGNAIGPISLQEGPNRVFIEFEEEGKLKVDPTFTREIYDAE